MECVRRKTIVFSVWQDHIILYLDVTVFITCSRGNFVVLTLCPTERNNKLILYMIHSCSGQLVVLQIDTDTSECDHRKGRN